MLALLPSVCTGYPDLSCKDQLIVRFVWFAGGTGARAWSCLQVERRAI
jgi:hypothetical protein